MKSSIKKLLHMFFYDIKIHQKIIIFTILIASVPILLMSYIFYYKSEQIIYSEVSSSYKQMLSQYIDNINYKMNLYSTMLDNITYSSILQDTSLSNENQDYSVYMDIINKVDTEVNSLMFSKKQDETYDIKVYPYDTSVTYYQTHIGNLSSIENTDWYKKFVLKKLNYNIGVSNTFNPNINTITLIRTIPSLKFQSFLKNIGIVKLDVYADMIFKIQEDKLDAKNKYLYILDINNNVVYSSDSNVKINKKIAGFNISNDLDTSKHYVSLNGRKGISVYKNIDAFGWKAVLFHDNSQIEKKLTDTRILILITDVVICSILIFLALIFSNTISKRLEMLTNKMKDVMNGDLEIRYKINGKDEIGVLDDDFNNMINRLNKLINENYVQKIEKREAQLNSLQAQLNPHFLYNTLESINSIASVYNCIEICNISQKLGDMFRYNINSGKSEFVTVKDEILHIKNYEYIQKIRFDDKFEIIYDIPEAIYDYYVLKFILQPIVENCIIHGFKGNKDILHINISAYLDNITLVIDIIDDGIGMNEERLEYLITYISEKDDNIIGNKKKSIGIKNVDSRLKLCFGDEYGISIYSSDAEGTKVSLRMPTKRN